MIAQRVSSVNSTAKASFPLRILSVRATDCVVRARYIVGCDSVAKPRHCLILPRSQQVHPLASSRAPSEKFSSSFTNLPSSIL